MYTDYAGIDYGRGMANIDDKGIRYGVIPFNKVDWWEEDSEFVYKDPTCPNCGNIVQEMN